jgi:hypothetical protein
MVSLFGLPDTMDEIAKKTASDLAAMTASCRTNFFLEFTAQNKQYFLFH